MSSTEPRVVEESKVEGGDHYRIVERDSHVGLAHDIQVKGGAYNAPDSWNDVRRLVVKLEDARETVRLMHLHKVELRDLARTEVFGDLPRTPWGQADHGLAHAPDVVNYGTPSHGGFKLSAARNKAVHPALRNKGGWYEQHVERAKVVLTFPELFTTLERRDAREAAVNWYPHAYMEATGETLTSADSFKLAEEEFRETNKDRWVVTSAARQDDGTTLCHATLGGLRQQFGGPAVEERIFVVPKDEYPRFPGFGFVIDEARHEELPTETPRP